MASYDIADDDDLYSRVRSETQYAETSDELDQPTLLTLVENAKYELDVKAGVSSSDFYSDKGVTLALLGLTCIKAKASVENITVNGWTIGGGDVSVEVDDPDAEDYNFARFEAMMNDGLVESDTASGSSFPTNINSGAYIS